jgi:hypothetical protein
MPFRIPADINPAKALDNRRPHISSAILIPSSFLVYQHDKKKIAPGKKGASTRPRQNLIARREPGELAAAVQLLTIAHKMIQHG